MINKQNTEKAYRIAGNIIYSLQQMEADSRFSEEEKIMMRILQKVVEDGFLAFDKYANSKLALPECIELSEEKDFKSMFITVDMLKRLYWRMVELTPTDCSEMSLFIMKDEFYASLHKPEGKVVPLVRVPIINK